SEYNSPPVMRSHLSSRTPTKTISPANIIMENIDCKLSLPPPSYPNFNHI
ncbi:11819_t:CDS:1, partial [Racocetra fulgida]